MSGFTSLTEVKYDGFFISNILPLKQKKEEEERRKHKYTGLKAAFIFGSFYILSALYVSCIWFVT